MPHFFGVLFYMLFGFGSAQELTLLENDDAVITKH